MPVFGAWEDDRKREALSAIVPAADAMGMLAAAAGAGAGAAGGSAAVAAAAASSGGAAASTSAMAGLPTAVTRARIGVSGP